jgi:SAM-dependent methyltransferase
MHEAAYQWVAAHVPEKRAKVLEVGSRDINGSIRPLFDGSDYTGLDITEGPGVDVVGDVKDHSGKYDVVVSCEVLEHHPHPQEVIEAAHRLLKRGGTLIVTAAGPSREPHSAVDGGPLRDGEHYANITVKQLTKWLAPFKSNEVDETGDDVRGVAIK